MQFIKNSLILRIRMVRIVHWHDSCCWKDDKVGGIWK
jgi:hypothetical protein